MFRNVCGSLLCPSLMLIVLLIGCCLNLGSAGPILNGNEGPIVDTPLGRIAGWEGTTREGRVYQSWTKVPYAQPPVGNLRLKPPEPVQKWNGTLDATGDVPMCMQMNGGYEDCLYLNVFRPKVRQISKMPVLVFVHGGSFQTDDVGPRGSAEYLMDEDVVLVQVNYRLNGFGFMTLGDEVMSGNFGMKDQTMALQWIKDNIAAFGGDPDSVTVFGGSAGGASTHMLLKSPLSEGLVSRAVSHSGSINHIWSLLNPEFTANCTLQVARATGCDRQTSKDILKCLQSLSAPRLFEAILKVHNMNAPKIPFVPVVEPKTVQGAFATEDLSLRRSNKPWITSTSNGEFLLFLEMAQIMPETFFEFLSKNLKLYLKDWIGMHIEDPEIMDEGAELLSKLYYNTSSPLEEFILQFAKMHMDDSFVYPSMVNILRHGGPKWLMRNEYRGELSSRDWQTGEQYPGTVAGHDDEKFYYFNYRSQYPHLGPKETKADYYVSKRLIKYLVNFAYFGDPTPAGSSFKWPQFANGEMLRVTADGDVTSNSDLYNQLKTLLDTWSYYLGWK